MNVPFLMLGRLKKRSQSLLIWFMIGVAWSAADNSRAQTPLSNLVFTVGTTIQNGGTNWSYLVIGSEQPDLLAGKRFAVFSKPGAPTDSSQYTLRSTLFQHNDSSSINALLAQSLVLREDLSSLSNAMNVVLHHFSGADTFTLPQKITTAFQMAVTDPDLLQTLSLLSHNHPGLNLCAGQAFSEPISAVTTYEIREVSPADGSPGEVIGRITITPGNPVVLPAPGFPWQITTNSPADNLRIRLRWGTPPELRRLALLSYGFNIWRIPAAQAAQLGFDVTPPTLSQLYANAVSVNDAPVLAVKDFSVNHGLGGADDPADSTTYFFADDNGHKFGQPAFNDGDQFFYFVTARDLLGRDGLVSPGGLGTACRQNTPTAPTHLSVKNSSRAVPVPTGAANDQRLELSWMQNTNTADLVTEYWIYRWDDPSGALTNDIAPLEDRIGVVPQLAGTNLNRYIDNGANAPAIPGATNFWYTIRAVSQAACGPLLSPHSAPIWGVLRQREAPDAPSGEILGSCGIPVVMFTNYNTLADPANTNGLTWNYRLTCQRRDRGIAWVQFTASGENGQSVFGPVYFPADEDSVSVDFNQPISTNSYVQISCDVGTFYGATSRVANASFADPVATNTQSEAVFFAGELLLTALNSSDPLLTILDDNQPYCVAPSSVARYPDGTVGMKFGPLVAFKLPMAIEVYSNSVWNDIGTAWPDTNGVYWISYPACLLGPMPQFRGCEVYLDDSPDCDQHIARAADDGPVAPIDIRFRPTPRTHEYRLYRRANGGPLSMIAQGPAAYDPADPSRAMVLADDAMPPSTTELCYFVQVLDENGNGSPLSFLGCKTVKPPMLPTPVLAEPLSLGDTNNPEVLLNWFCPTSGVHRFQIQIERADQPGSGKPTGFTGSQLTKVPYFNPVKYYAGLVAHSLSLAHFDEAYLTPPSGVNFGSGPQYTTTAGVLANVPYNISVASVGEQDEAHAPSMVWKFTWRPTNALPTVPWPARPLPPVTHFDEITNTLLLQLDGITNAFYRVAAVILRYDTGNERTYLDTRYPVGIRIGALANYSALYNGGLRINIGTTNFFRYLPATFERDPSHFLFTRVSQNPDHSGQPLLPIVVYRQQVPNSVFPKVSGSLTQVTPLVERLPWNFSPGVSGLLYNPPTTTVLDLLIAGGSEQVHVVDSYVNFYYIYVRDQQPVMVGASYQYFVMRMNEKHEVAEIIDAGVVTIPPN